jgi:hypothetical protein
MASRALLLIATTWLDAGLANDVDTFGAMAPFLGDTVSILYSSGNWYWTNVIGSNGPWNNYGGFGRIQPSSHEITPSSIFKVEKAGGNKVTLLEQYSGKYLSVINYGCPTSGCINYIQPAKSVADYTCEFEVIPNGNNLAQIHFRAYDGQFLQFVSDGSNGNFIMAVHMEVGPYTLFEVRPGSLTPWTVQNIYFDIASAVTHNTHGIVGDVMSLENNGPEPQTQTFSFSKSRAVTTSSSYTGGFSLGTSTDFQSGIPLFVDGKISLTASTQQKWVQGKTQVSSQKVGDSQPFTIGAYQKGTCTFVMTEGVAKIPYTVTYINYGLGGQTKTSTGTYNIQDFYNVNGEYTETPLSTMMVV